MAGGGVGLYDQMELQVGQGFAGGLQSKQTVINFKPALRPILVYSQIFQKALVKVGSLMI